MGCYMTENGATAAYRGYRLQALYILSRILSVGSDKSIVFLPESGGEDLSIKRGEHLTEKIQIKSYENLNLSKLEPQNTNSFFRRAVNYFDEENPSQVILVNIGTIGPEIKGAWGGDKKYIKILTKKMLQHGYTEDEVNQLLNGIQLVEQSEDVLKKEISSRLKDLLVGVDPDHAFDLLNYWLYIQSENKQSITYEDLIEKINSVGKFLSECAQHHLEWFTSIFPILPNKIPDNQILALKEEFFQGASTRYQHILAELDFKREGKLAEINKAFIKSKIVIIHSASGQGKTALAYRYIHDFYPAQWRFEIRLVENRQHALRITTALSGHARALNAPMLIYIDVSPKDMEWVELVRQLSRNPYFQILVTIREEDFRRSNIPAEVNYTTIDLIFDKVEAQIIYDRILSAGIQKKYLSFDDAWDSFRESGPLLEFIYMLTQTTTLRQRLENQVNRLKQEVREKNLSPDELLLLRLVAVVTAYEGRLYIPTLIKNLNIPEPQTSLHYFENEYLIRISSDETYIEALHPIRSKILVELLTDPVFMPWLELIKRAIPYVPEEDLETIFLFAFVDYPDEFDKIIKILMGIKPTTWAGFAGVLRSLLWAGAKRYIDTNLEVINLSKELMGPGWFFVPDLNFAGEEAPNTEGWWRNLGDLISHEMKGKIEEIRALQAPKQELFEFSQLWLSGQEQQPKIPDSSIEWSAFAEVLYWASRFGIAHRIQNWITDETLFKAIDALTLTEISEVSLALNICEPNRQKRWLNANLANIKVRLAKEYRIIYLEEKKDVMFIHFLTYPEENLFRPKEKKKSVHQRTLERIQLIRQLIPEYSEYGAQGYGHQMPGFENIPDDSTKIGIPKKNLVPKWPLRLNIIALGLARLQFRSETWEDYTGSIIGLRKDFRECFNELIEGLDKYFQNEKPYNFLKSKIFVSRKWDHVVKELKDIPLLPKVAVDPWGIGQVEGALKENGCQEESRKFSGNARSNDPTSNILPGAILQQKYQRYLDNEREFLGKIAPFMEQAEHVSVINIQIGKMHEDNPARLSILSYLKSKGVDEQNRFLSLLNLWDAYSNLRKYQQEFNNLFKIIVGEKVLSDLESKENNVFESLLLHWTFFVIKPNSAFCHSKNQLPQRFQSDYYKFVQRIDNSLRKVKYKTEILNKNLTWNNETALWIRIDIQDMLEQNKAFEEVINGLKDTIARVEYGSYEYYLIEKKCKYIVILQTVKGKMIEKVVLPLITNITLTQNHPIEEKSYLYTLQNIPSSLANALDLEIVQIQELDTVDEFVNSYNELITRIALLGNLSNIPDPPDEVMPVLQDFTKITGKELSKYMQSFFDASAIFANRCNVNKKEELQKRSQVLEAGKILEEVLTRFEGGILELPLTEIKDCTKEFQELFKAILYVKSVWINDILTDNSI